MAKKITAIVSLSIIGILILATIIMANVDVNHKINCADPNYIYVQYGSGTSQYISGDDDIYSEILDRINNASKESSLNALFAGTINDTPQVVTRSTTGSGYNPYSNSSAFYITFNYNDAQKVKVGNKDYVDSSNENYYYKALVFEVTANEGMQTVKVYIIPYYQNGTTTPNLDSNNYYRYYELTADFSDLYSYLNDNGFNN